MKNLFAVTLCILLSGIAAAAAAPWTINSEGVLNVDGEASFAAALYYPGKQYNIYTQTAYYRFNPVRTVTGNVTAFFAPMKKEGMPDTTVAYTVDNPLALTAAYRFSYPDGFRFSQATLEISFPISSMIGKEVDIDGARIVFPEKLGSGGHTFAECRKVGKFELPLKTGILQLTFPRPRTLRFMDGRFFKSPYFKIRIPMTDLGTPVKESEIRVGLSFRPYPIEPVELTGVANRKFRDDKAGDRKGGWTDQGSEQDMSPLPAGRLQLAPAQFEIADDRKGDSCIVLGGGGLNYLPHQAVLDLNNRICRTVFLLHAIAWAPAASRTIGLVEVTYADGQIETFPVKSQYDVDNWWRPNRSFPNALLAWREDKLSLGELRTVGLFLSAFHFEPKPVKTLTLRSNGVSVWMIAGISTSPIPIALQANTTSSFQLKRDKNWRVYHPRLAVEPGSALDLSFLEDAPAGKYGFLKATPDGKFTFEKRADVPVRFYGANICFETSMMSHGDSDLQADLVARNGYNAVRLHHFDLPLIGWNNFSTDFDPGRFDRFLYQIAAFKKRGVYLTLDLYTVRNYDVKRLKTITYDKNRSYYTIPNRKDDYSLAAMILPEVRNELKQFTRNLLTTVNPYTGLALKDDPALTCISILNENTILVNLEQPVSIIKSVYERQFAEWAKKRNLAVTAENHAELFRRFALDVYRDYYDDMTGFLKELGVKALVTDQNFCGIPNTTIQRLRYGYVDEHQYQGSRKGALQDGLSILFHSVRRVFGKPYTITEYNYAYPNPYRGESGVIFPAYAAMQGWDGIYRFNFANRPDLIFSPETGLEVFDVANDPVRNIPERLAVMMFRRMDVASSRIAFPTVTGTESSIRDPFLRHYPAFCSAPAAIARVGTVVCGPDGKTFRPLLPTDAVALLNISTELKANAVKLPVFGPMSPEELLRKLSADKLIAPVKDRCFVSSTGEIRCDLKRKVFQVTTPRTEAFVLTAGQRAAGEAMSVASTDTFATIGATSLDGKPLKQSRRVLLVHVTDMQNENTVFVNSRMESTLKSAPRQSTILAKRGVAKLAFRTSMTDPRLYALDCAGKRIGEVPFTRNAETLSFTVDTFAQSGDIVFAYELVQEKTK